MLNKRIVLGTLIAGAFLLPMSAQAGKVTGPCVNCHTMHDSQNAAAPVGSDDGLSNGENTLLLADCIGCHTDAATRANNAAGLYGGSPKAPQVDAITNTLSGGYFTTGAVDTQHNVVGYANDDSVAALAGGNAPGGIALGAQIRCEDCHGGSGGHHGTAATYRLLATYGALLPIDGTGPANYGVRVGATIGVGDRSANIYTMDGANSDINNLCASCHGTFHQSEDPTLLAGNQRSAVAGTWIRHPTDIKVEAAAGPSIVIDNLAADNDVVALGTRGGTEDIVLCISCHVPHGNNRPDMLAFSYDTTQNTAGGTAIADRSVGCETCHSYSGFGM